MTSAKGRKSLWKDLKFHNRPFNQRLTQKIVKQTNQIGHFPLKKNNVDFKQQI